MYINWLLLLWMLPTLITPSTCTPPPHHVAPTNENFIQIVEEAMPDGNINFYAINKAFCPLTMSLEFNEIQNYSSEVKLPLKKVLAQSEEQQFLLTLNRKSVKKEAFYAYRYSYTLGDELNPSPDENFAYWFPYEAGTKELVGQGNNGKFSHKGINAIDFNLKKGTKICAAREGVVVMTKGDSNQGCSQPRCQDMSNYVIIYHSDGTFANYGHLKYNGVKVEVGQKVKAGQVIGLSGNTGWSSGPHLHFEIYYKKEGMHYTVPAKFLIKDQQPAIPKVGKRYVSYHPN